MTGAEMVEIEQIVALCCAATAHYPWPSVQQAVRDELDGSVLVLMSSWPEATEAITALTRHGLAAAHHPVGLIGEDVAQVRVAGWDARLLRRRLAILLAGVDDLSTEWAATGEIAMYCYDRRTAAAAAATGTEDPDLDWQVSAEVETILRSSTPLPHAVPAVSDLARLQQLIEAATERYEQLLAQHVEFAEHVTVRYRAELAVGDHASAAAATLAGVANRHPAWP